ncbi:MAG: rod-binding protein [Bacillota bacterium]|nr:rod-binding protein [Bacillota bacterium]
MDIGSIGNNVTANNSSLYDTSKSKAADDDFANKLQSALDSKDEKQLKSVCQDFESIMLNMMYKEMKATVPKSDLIPEDSGNDIFTSMMDEDLMNEASKGNGIGLGDMLYKQLSKQLQNTYKVEDGGNSTVDEKK